MQPNALRQALSAATDDDSERIFARTLQSIRTHLAMEVAFIAEFSDGLRIYRHVDATHDRCGIVPGASDPLQDTLCLRVTDGRLPQLMCNAADHEAAATLPVMQPAPVGAHLSVPVRLSDGRTYGTFCCLSTQPDYQLNERDLGVMRAFAEVVAEQVERDIRRREEVARKTQRIDEVFAGTALGIAYQPIFDVVENRPLGFEALSRFSAPPQRTPDLWFAEAASIGRGVELECLAIRRALQALDRLPPWAYVSVNASPATVLSGMLEGAMDGAVLTRVVVEITEHEAVHHYQDLAAAFAPLQARGLRLAIDDAGAGYASFRHILNLAPNLIKLDISITRDIHRDRSRRALAAALHRFAEETECGIVAEGMECAEELNTLRELGYDQAQGYFLGRPFPLEQALALCRQRPGHSPH